MNAEPLAIYGAVTGTIASAIACAHIFWQWWSDRSVRVNIEVPPQDNSFTDVWEGADNTPHLVYCHHLNVRNLTRHKPVINCRVWLKRVCIRDDSDNWAERKKFAVPRLMDWAPFEYSRDKRTFGNYQVFDLGKTVSNLYFEIAVSPVQGGTFDKQVPAGKRVRLYLFVTADNYFKEELFCFEVAVRKLVEGKAATPSTVTAVKLRKGANP